MRELFTDSIRAGLANIDLHDLKEPAPDAKAPELIFKDSVRFPDIFSILLPVNLST